MHLFLSEWSLKPSSHMQRLPRGVETQRWSHPPLFTSQTSPRLTSENINRKKFRSGQWVCWHTETFYSFSLMQQAAKVLSKQTEFSPITSRVWFTVRDTCHQLYLEKNWMNWEGKKNRMEKSLEAGKANVTSSMFLPPPCIKERSFDASSFSAERTIKNNNFCVHGNLHYVHGHMSRANTYSWCSLISVLFLSSSYFIHSLNVLINWSNGCGLDVGHTYINIQLSLVLPVEQSLSLSVWNTNMWVF